MTSPVEFWDWRSDYPCSGRDSDTPTTELEYGQRRLIRRLIGDPAGLRILKTDLWNEGGRKGCFNVEDYRSAKRFIGVDISPKTCVKAAKNHPWIAIVCGEVPLILHLCPSASVDLILDISVIDHMRNHTGAIKEYARLLRPGGRLFIVWNKVNHLADAFVRIRRWMKGIPHIFHLYHYKYSVAHIMGLLEHSGFRVIEQGGWNNPFSRLLDGSRAWHYMSHWAMVCLEAS